MIPYLGYRLLPDFTRTAARRSPRGSGRAFAGGLRRKRISRMRIPSEVYDTPFYRRFRRIVDWCVAHRWIVIGITLAAFVGALGAVPARAAAVLSRRRRGPS